MACLTSVKVAFMHGLTKSDLAYASEKWPKINATVMPLMRCYKAVLQPSQKHVHLFYTHASCYGITALMLKNTATVKLYTRHLGLLQLDTVTPKNQVTI